MQTIFWHDYETFGADPRRDRACQFAGVRTDLDLNIIEDPVTFYAKPTEDYLPSVHACLITGITPQEAMNKGVCESEFALRINQIFAQADTCVAGYNSVRFDDEVSRNLFYRNFIDPYEREWKNGNSRWDIIDVVRLAHALRPEGINWPVGDDGKVSFRLEKLTEANGIAHEAAHDAMSDVYATIALAKLIKEKQPALYSFAFDLRTKKAVNRFFDENDGQPFLHVSSKIPATRGCCAMMQPLMPHPINQNARIVFDLRQDPEILARCSAQELRDLLYSKTQYDEAGVVINERPALKLIHTNKCPMLAPASMVKVIPEARLDEWGMPLALLRDNARKLKKLMPSLGHVREVFSSDDERFETPTDPDLMLYSGSFFSPGDRQKIARVRQASSDELADYVADFDDSRLDEMLFRYKARNFPECLSSDERDRWSKHCHQQLLSKASDFRTFEVFADELQQAVAGLEQSSDKLMLLEEVQLYAESIYPY